LTVTVVPNQQVEAPSPCAGLNPLFSQLQYIVADGQQIKTIFASARRDRFSLGIGSCIGNGH